VASAIGVVLLRAFFATCSWLERWGRWREFQGFLASPSTLLLAFRWGHNNLRLAFQQHARNVSHLLSHLVCLTAQRVDLVVTSFLSFLQVLLVLEDPVRKLLHANHNALLTVCNAGDCTSHDVQLAIHIVDKLLVLRPEFFLQFLDGLHLSFKLFEAGSPCTSIFVLQSLLEHFSVDILHVGLLVRKVNRRLARAHHRLSERTIVRPPRSERLNCQGVAHLSRNVDLNDLAKVILETPRPSNL